MSLEAINEQLLRSVAVGIALFDASQLKLEFRNDVFESWFDGTDIGTGLNEVFPDIDIDALKTSLTSQQSFNSEIQFRRKRRTMVISMNFRLTEVADQAILVLECNNISRIRELESMIESYSRMVERNARDIQREKEQVEQLLLNIMPRSAYEEFRDFGAVSPQQYESVVLLELQFIDFDQKVNELAPADLIGELNEIHSACDRIAEQLGCERIRTSGNSYRCVMGMDTRDDQVLLTIARAATRFLRYLKRRNSQARSDWHCSIGIGAGACVGSVVGSQKYVYDLFGEAVTRTETALKAASSMQIVAALAETQYTAIECDDLNIDVCGQANDLILLSISE